MEDRRVTNRGAQGVVGPAPRKTAGMAGAAELGANLGGMISDAPKKRKAMKDLRTARKKKRASKIIRDQKV